MTLKSSGWWVGLFSVGILGIPGVVAGVGVGLRAAEAAECAAPAKVSVTREASASEPLLAPAFVGALDPALEPVEAFVSFFDDFPGLGARLAVEMSDLRIRVVPTSPLENRILLAGQRLHRGVPMESGELRFQFAADTRTLISMSFADVVSWGFEPPTPTVPAGEAARLARAAATPTPTGPST